jgi:hypothetical protein
MRTLRPLLLLIPISLLVALGAVILERQKLPRHAEPHAVALRVGLPRDVYVPAIGGGADET